MTSPEITNAAREAAEAEISERDCRDAGGRNAYELGCHVQSLLSTQAARIAELEKALRRADDCFRRIEDTRFGYDGDCGTVGLANEGRGIIEKALAVPSSPSAVPDEREGWRMLEPSEVVIQDDEYWSHAAQEWRLCDESVGGRAGNGLTGCFRRRIHKEESK